MYRVDDDLSHSHPRITSIEGFCLFFFMIRTMNNLYYQVKKIKNTQGKFSHQRTTLFIFLTFRSTATSVGENFILAVRMHYSNFPRIVGSYSLAFTARSLSEYKSPYSGAQFTK